METIGNLPFFRLGFDENGVPTDSAQLAKLISHIESAKPARLAVVSHGWRNDENYATSLYQQLFTNVAVRLKANGVQDSALPTVVGVYWPSMALPESGFVAAQPSSGGGAAAATSSPSVKPEILDRQIDQLISAFGGEGQLKQAKALLKNLEDRPGDQATFVELLRSVALPSTDSSEDNSDRFLKGDPNILFERLTNPIIDIEIKGGSGGALGLKESVSGAVDSILYAAEGALGSAFRLVNYLTYYQMKERAGIIGGGLNKALGEIRARFASLPIHLIGHSFGARVVTAAAARGVKLDPCSLSLLQGAYSHNGLAAASEWTGAKDGFFRAIFSEKRVKGPIMATHTANDQAVGIAYPIASRLAGQNAEALGDANDPFGGVGRNGVLHVYVAEKGPDGKKMLGPDGTYAFEAGKTNNLLADEFIKNHGDVTNPAVANAVAQVILTM